ncbi:hypothetical protein [Bradyrhizobium zhanjiangense]|uniref:hypothetical protein n=1 Tax=Bradyrhizobium zhanjiangense TaxID=1325107 RepID=UPI001ABFF5D1|nr:hypothetical protein [Bradyrhizobium zhanjiangense]
MCKILGQEEIKPQKVRYYRERRDAEFEQKMAEVLCVYREVQVLKKAAAKSRKAGSKKSGKPVAIVSYDEKPGIQASRRRHRICRPCQASIRPWRAILSIDAMARSACWQGSIF